MASQARKWKFARARLISDIKHTITGALELTAASKSMLILCKDKSLDRYWTEFMENLENIVTSTETMEDADAFFAENQALEDEYHRAKIHLDDICPTKDGEPSTNRSFAESTVQGHNETIAPRKLQKSHLPDIKLEPFDGNYDNWHKFSQMFPKMIEKEDLDYIDKFYYLHQSLVGEPLLLIKHLPVAEGSYEKAWALLKKSYEVRRHIVNSQFELFFSMKKMKEESAAGIREMLRICLECESAFSALELDAESIGLMMTFYCATQMDPVTAREWEIELKNHASEPKLSELVTFLQTRCRLMSQIEKTAAALATQSKVVTTESQSKDGSKHSRPQKSTKAFLSQPSEPAVVYKCNVCEANHKTLECPMLVNADIDERWRLVTDRRLCYNCLFPHMIADCNSRFSCRKCKKRHATVLHREPKVKTEVEPSPTTSTFTGTLAGSGQTILATACVTLMSEHGGTTVIRALIDQGSTANFISEKICQLAMCRRHPVLTTITSLNNSNTAKITSAVDVTIGSLYDKEYQTTFRALVVPKITNVYAVPRRISNNWRHLTGLQLADPKYFESGDIDLLIGAREYAEIIETGLLKGPPNAPIAQLTKFGWVLSGACETTRNSIEQSATLQRKRIRYPQIYNDSGS